MPSDRRQPRELRRRVLLNARMRTAAGWSDACILNVSSRGLLIHAGRLAMPGATIELWHGELPIVARVVWREGAKAGLRADEPLPVERILLLGSTPQLRLTASGSPMIERRKRPRTHEQRRDQSRVIEYVAIAVIAAGLAGAAFSLVEQALRPPLAAIRTALTG